MGFLDRAKKLAEQAKNLAEDALAEAKAKQQASSSTSTSTSTAPAGDPRLGTPYVPGMFGRAGWRERGLTDPAALLPIDDRDAAGVPRATKSEILEEPFGMGRRWSSAGRSVGLYYQLYPEHEAWQPPGGKGATATLDDGRSLTFIDGPAAPVVLEADGVDQPTVDRLAAAVRRAMSSS